MCAGFSLSLSLSLSLSVCVCVLGPGVVERNHVRFEAGLPCFPRDFPDAVAAYRTWAEETAAANAALEAALPPPQRRSHVAAEVLCGALGAHSSKLTVSCSHSFSQSNSVPYVWVIRRRPYARVIGASERHFGGPCLVEGRAGGQRAEF